MLLSPLHETYQILFCDGGAFYISQSNAIEVNSKQMALFKTFELDG